MLILRCMNAHEIAQAELVCSTTEHIFTLFYDELRRAAERLMFHERKDNTLSATALVNEAYVRLETYQPEQIWESRAHFFTAAAEAMRRILIDRARAKLALKRSAVRESISIEQLESAELDADLLLDLDLLLDKLAAEDSQAAEFVKLRLFAGRSVVESGEILGLTRYSAYQLWDYSQCWFAARAL